MKKTLLIALLLIPFIGFSQTTKPIEGFLGIKFGSSKADVIAAIKAKGGEQVESTNDNELRFDGIMLGHLKPIVLIVAFDDDKAYNASFIFKSDLDDKTIDFYNDLVSQIADVYGPGKVTKTFRGTFHDGDGYEITAIQEGDADFFTTWPTDKAVLQAKIVPNLYIDLIYQDNALAADALQKQKAKEKGDF